MYTKRIFNLNRRWGPESLVVLNCTVKGLGKKGIKSKALQRNTLKYFSPKMSASISVSSLCLLSINWFLSLPSYTVNFKKEIQRISKNLDFKIC